MSEEMQPTPVSQELILQVFQAAILSIAKWQNLPPEVDSLPQSYLKLLDALVQQLKAKGLAGQSATPPQRMAAIRQQLKEWGLLQSLTIPTEDQIINHYPEKTRQSALTNKVIQPTSVNNIMVGKKTKSEIKFNIYILIFLIIFFVFAINDCSNRAKERAIQKERSEQWKQSPAGMNSKAEWESRLKNYPVKSMTGDLFYKGMLCSSDCSGHIEGYQYAMDYGMTNNDKCYETYSSSFLEGCKKAVEDILAEMQPYEY